MRFAGAGWGGGGGRVQECQGAIHSGHDGTQKPSFLKLLGRDLSDRGVGAGARFGVGAGGAGGGQSISWSSSGEPRMG